MPDNRPPDDRYDDQNGHQMRCFGSGCFHPFYFICQLLFYLSCNFFPIY